MIKEGLPFKNPGIKEKGGGNFFDIREIKDNPDFLVKELRIERLENFRKTSPRERDAAFGKEKNLEAQAQRLNAYYQRLAVHPELQEFIPKTHVVIGSNEEGEETFFAVSEKIAGEKFNEIVGGLTAERKENLLKILNGLIDVYIETYDGQVGQIAEFAYAHNLMLGTSKSDPENEKIYLVDLFPVFNYAPDDFRTLIREFAERNRLPFDEVQKGYRKLEVLKKRDEVKPTK